MIDVAYLRVYRPAEEVRLPVAVSARGRPVLGEAVITSEPQTADAWEVEWEGRLWRCPRTPRRRMLESLVAYQQATERYGVGMIDRTVAEAARRELLRIRTGVARPAPVLASAWHPPLRWFLAFSATDLRAPSILRASLGVARQRLEGRIETMRRQGLPGVLIEEVSELAEWLGSFDDDGMLELDYSEVVEHLDPEDRVWDETAAEVEASARLLEEGDMEAAISQYMLALARWAPVQAIGFSS